MNLNYLSNRINFLKSLQAIIAIIILWKYNTKMLNPTVDSISSMSRSYFTDGVQQNPAYYSPNTLSSIILIVFLFFLFLTRNDILPKIKSKKYNFSKSLAGLFITLIILLMVSRPDLGRPRSDGWIMGFVRLLLTDGRAVVASEEE